MRWQDKLTKKELRHLKETINGPLTLVAFRRNLEHQARLRAKGGAEPCWDCRFIARKLGISL